MKGSRMGSEIRDSDCGCDGAQQIITQHTLHLRDYIITAMNTNCSEHFVSLQPEKTSFQ